MLFFLLIVYVVPRVSFFSCNSEIMYSYLLDILFLIVLSFSFGGQFLYGNSVSPCVLLSFSYCTFIYIYIYFLWGFHACTLPRCTLRCTHDTGVKTRRTYGKLDERSRPGSARERSCLRGKVGMRRQYWWVTFVCPLYLMRYYILYSFICVLLLRKIMQTNINKPE